MFDVGWSEILVIAVVAIVVIGPKDLPKTLRALGKATARMRSTANEFRNQFNDALKEAELDDVKNIIDEARSLNPKSKLTQVFDPIRSAGDDLRSSLNSTNDSINQSAAALDAKPSPEATAVVAAPAVPDPVAQTEAAVNASKPVVRKSPATKAVDTAKPVAAKATKAKPVTGKSAAKAAPAKSASEKTAPAKVVAVKATAAKAATTKAKSAPDKIAAVENASAKPAAKTSDRSNKKAGTKA